MTTAAAVGAFFAFIMRVALEGWPVLIKLGFCLAVFAPIYLIVALITGGLNRQEVSELRHILGTLYRSGFLRSRLSSASEV